MITWYAAPWAGGREALPSCSSGLAVTLTSPPKGQIFYTNRAKLSNFFIIASPTLSLLLKIESLKNFSNFSFKALFCIRKPAIV
jgi:hypothetical protein